MEKVDSKYDEIYVVGDLNCNFLSKPHAKFHTSQLRDMLISFQMNQVLTEPTRVTAASKTLIDHSITNNKEKLLVQTGVYPLSISDHYLC